MKNGLFFYKINIDFEYMNEIYTILAEPYHTLLELKEKVTKKIFPTPRNMHCFYKNLDIYDNEGEQISRLFPYKKKLKIILKKPSKEKKLIKPYKSYKYLQTKTKSNIIDNKETQIPKIDMNSDSSIKFRKKTKIKTNNHLNNKNLVKQRLLSFTSLLDNPKTRKPSHDMYETIDEDDLFYHLHKNKLKQYKLVNNDINNNENNNEKNNINFNKNNDIILEEDSIYHTERRPKRLNKLQPNINQIKIPNNKEQNENLNDKFKTQREKEDIQLLLKSLENLNENESSIQTSKINDEDIKNDNKEKENNTENKNDKGIQNQIIEDENYICIKCKQNIINYYCIKCNEFICKNCLEKCKSDNHDYIEIKLNEDCLSNINLYGSSAITNLEKKINEILEYDKELKIYDIKKKRDNLISMFHEILNLYSQITQILKITYKEKDVKNAMTKYKLDSDKIKEEINEIINKAESYIKSDSNNNQPKFKIMNMKYFFGMINEKQNNHKLLTEKMNVYSLNTNININIEKSFSEIEELMKKISNKENAFNLNNNLKEEYNKLLKEHQNINSNKDKKKMFFKRKSVMINKSQLPNFPIIISNDKNNNDKNNNDKSSKLSKENK